MGKNPIAVFTASQPERKENSPYNRLKDSSMNRVLNVSEDCTGVNESFLLARSLSPRQRTGMFGVLTSSQGFNPHPQFHNQQYQQH